MKKLNNLSKCIRHCASIGNLPSSYIDSMSYQEQLDWFCNFLQNTVIPAINDNNEAVEEIQNWFNNLDVQDEINNKLEQMANNGELTLLIKRYIDPLFDDFKSDINNKIEEFEEDFEVIKDEVASVTAGSPAGVYSTISSLQQADPDHSRIYVVEQDGNWYFWNSTTNQWKNGGQYQAVQIDNQRITYAELNPQLSDNIIFSDYSTIQTSELFTDKYVGGQVGNTILKLELSNHAYGVLPVEAKDIIDVNLYKDYVSSNLPVMMICDVNDKILARFNNIENNHQVLIMPNGAKKIYFNLLSTQNNNVENKYEYFRPLKITKCSYIDERVVYSDNEVEISNSAYLPNIAYNKNSYWNYHVNQDGFFTYIFDVEPNTKIRLTSKIASATYEAGIFATEDLNSAIKYVGNYSEGDQFNEVLVVPPLAKKLIVTQYGSANVPHVYKKTLNDIDVNKLKVKKENNLLTITSKNGNYIKFNNFGGNNLFMIQEYKVGTTTIQTGTDMTPAPYIVTAVNNADGDRTFTSYTGGNHQFNNQGSGSVPTASQESLVIYTDNNILSSNSEVTCDQVTIVETNLIQASNTCKSTGNGRNVLREKITFKFDGKTLKVTNVIEPLEEIIIQEYYGIQTALISDENYVIYADKLYNINNYTSCQERPEAIIGSNIIKSKLYDCGLGDYRYNNSNVKVRLGYSKSYFVPIKDNTVHFTDNNKYYIKGEYVFDNNVEL